MFVSLSGCLPWWLHSWLRAVLAAAAQLHKRGSYCISLAREKITIPNSKYSFYWTCIAFAPSWSWKIPSQTIVSQGPSVPQTVLEARSIRSRCQQVWFLLRPLSLACSWLPSPCVFAWTSLYMRAPDISLRVLISSSCKDSSQTGLEPTLMVSF